MTIESDCGLRGARNVLRIASRMVHALEKVDGCGKRRGSPVPAGSGDLPLIFAYSRMAEKNFFSARAYRLISASFAFFRLISRRGGDFFAGADGPSDPTLPDWGGAS